MTAKSRQHTIRIHGEQYYTAQKAQEVLDMSYSGLRYQVLIGNIKAETPPGRRQSYYKSDDVEQVAKDLKSFSLHRASKPTQFTRVKTREEVESIVEISQNNIFRSESNVFMEIVNERMKILEKNPGTYYVLKDEKQIIGYVALWPIKPEKLNSILAQPLPVKISPEDIEPFEGEKSIDIYINAMHVKADFIREEKRYYGARLISGLLGVIENLGKAGIAIDIIATRSNMPEGIRLIRKAGFTEIPPLTPDRRTFIIEVEKSGIPFIQEYKRLLEESRTSKQK